MPRRHLLETAMIGSPPCACWAAGFGIHVADDETQLGRCWIGYWPKVVVRRRSIPALADSRFTDALRAFLTGQIVDRK
jgi:hypothetical protein